MKQYVADSVAIASALADLIAPKSFGQKSAETVRSSPPVLAAVRSQVSLRSGS